MKLLKMFHGKKPSSSVMTSAASSRTSSSSSNVSSAPQTSELAGESMSEMQKFSPQDQKFPSSSLHHGSAMKTGRTPAALLSPGADPEQQELASAFKLIDVNGDGRISVSELGEILRSLGEDPSESELQLMVAAVDADGDGHIDLEEFIALNRMAVEKTGTESRSEELRAAFYVFDIDKNNYISAEELHQVLRGLGQQSLTIEECSRMINGVDSDGDGFVNFEEFERMMTTNWVH